MKYKAIGTYDHSNDKTKFLHTVLGYPVFTFKSGHPVVCIR
jgi:hypothetical protein